MRSRLGLLFSLVMLCFVNVANSYDCTKDNLGWHFYCDPAKIQDKDQITVENIAASKAELQSIQSKLEDLKVHAILHPTEKNIIEYIKYQQEQMNRSVKFSDVWQKALWKNPELDYMVKTPLSTIGHEARDEIKQTKIKKMMPLIGERYGLFFFYTSTCPYCIKYSAVMKAFSDHYKVPVVAVSVDGNKFPEWPDSLVNQGQLEAFGLSGKPVPITVLFDNKSKELITLGFGLLTISDLEERIYELILKQGQYEKNN